MLCISFQISVIFISGQVIQISIKSIIALLHWQFQTITRIFTTVRNHMDKVSLFLKCSLILNWRTNASLLRFLDSPTNLRSIFFYIWLQKLRHTFNNIIQINITPNFYIKLLHEQCSVVPSITVMDRTIKKTIVFLFTPKCSLTKNKLNEHISDSDKH